MECFCRKEEKFREPPVLAEMGNCASKNSELVQLRAECALLRNEICKRDAQDSHAKTLAEALPTLLSTTPELAFPRVLAALEAKVAVPLIVGIAARAGQSKLAAALPALLSKAPPEIVIPSVLAAVDVAVGVPLIVDLAARGALGPLSLESAIPVLLSAAAPELVIPTVLAAVDAKVAVPLIVGIAARAGQSKLAAALPALLSKAPPEIVIPSVLAAVDVAVGVPLIVDLAARGALGPLSLESAIPVLLSAAAPELVIPTVLAAVDAKVAVPLILSIAARGGGPLSLSSALPAILGAGSPKELFPLVLESVPLADWPVVLAPFTPSHATALKRPQSRLTMSTASAIRKNVLLCPLLVPACELLVGETLYMPALAVLFVDIVDSTQLYEAQGDAAAYEAVRDALRQASSFIEAHGGMTVKLLGDAVFAVFGTVEAAFSAACETLADDTRAFGLKMRAGATVGPVIAANVNGVIDFYGSTINLCARISGTAEADELVLPADIATSAILSPQVAALVGKWAAVAFEASLKGFAGKNRLHRFLRRS